MPTYLKFKVLLDFRSVDSCYHSYFYCKQIISYLSSIQLFCLNYSQPLRYIKVDCFLLRSKSVIELKALLCLTRPIQLFGISGKRCS